MNSIIDLPLDIQVLLFEVLNNTCNISFRMLQHINKFYRQQTTNFMISHRISNIKIDFETVVSKGYLGILKWFNPGNYRISDIMCYCAARNGHLPILKWAIKTGWEPTTSKFYVFAAKGGHVNILDWAASIKGGLWMCEDEIYRYGVRYNHLEVLKWQRSKGSNNDFLICTWAASYGDLEILKWARSNGCAWNSETTYLAAHSKHTEVLKWAFENGCKYCNETALYIRRKYPYLLYLLTAETLEKECKYCPKT
jgi:hypothetical protein